MPERGDLPDKRRAELREAFVRVFRDPASAATKDSVIDMLVDAAVAVPSSPSPEPEGENERITQLRYGLAYVLDSRDHDEARARASDALLIDDRRAALVGQEEGR